MKFTVTKITKQDDRILFYGHPEYGNEYWVIGGKNDTDIQVGDEIEYEDGGFNFGWLVQKIEK